MNGEKGPLSEEGLLDMDQAIEMLKTTRATFYRWLRGGKIRGLKVGRQWRFERGEVERFLKGEQPRIELRGDISPLIQILTEKKKEFHAPDTTLSEESPVQRAVKLMIEVGLALKASDVHLSPHELENDTVAVLRYRVDGVLKEMARVDLRLLPGMIEQWKILAGCNLLEQKPQEGRIKFELLVEKKSAEILFSFLPTFLGGSFTAGYLAQNLKSLTLDHLDYAPADKEKLLRWVEGPYGMMIFTGPAGSGKTTSLLVCLNHIAGPEVKIMTVEDPVYFVFPWIVQTQVSEKMGYPEAVRAILQSDPDVVFIGELQDAEVIGLAHRLSMTGHLVMTQMHVEESARALVRMVEMGAEPFVVADSTTLVVSQRLVRRLCPECSRPEELPPHLLARAESYARTGGLDWNTLPRNFRKPIGCPKCKQLGYSGRLQIAELLEVSPEIGDALKRGASVEELRALALRQGMTTMAADGIRKAAEGKTTVDEIIRTLGIR
jgi:excisionase family DNA binding protein